MTSKKKVPGFLVPVETIDSEENRKRLTQVYEALGEFRKLHPVVTVHQVQTFILVALNEGISLNEIAEKGQSKQSTTSRQLIDLSEADRERDKGMGLITRTPNPDHFRRNQYLLSDKGKEVLSRFIRLLYSAE